MANRNSDSAAEGAQQRNEMVVSIIVPVYNVDRYLDQCVYSIIQQTYTSLQIILVDDCSTDTSSSLCDHWARKDNRIQVIHRKTNGGLSAARNSGLEQAVGEYISFVDSDDWISETLIEHTLTNMKYHSADIGMFAYTLVDEDGNPVSSSANNNTSHTEVIVGNPEDAFYYANTSDSVAYYMWNKIYEASLLKNFQFTTTPTGEDAIANTEIFERMHVFVYTSIPEYFYRVRTSSLSHSVSFTSPTTFLSPMLTTVKTRYPQTSIYAKLFCLKLLIWYYSELLNSTTTTRQKIEKRSTEKYIRSSLSTIRTAAINKEIKVSYAQLVRLLLIGYQPRLYSAIYKKLHQLRAAL